VVRQSAQVKASRRLDIRSKATVAAPRTKREGRRRRGGDLVTTARDPVAAAARDLAAAVAVAAAWGTTDPTTVAVLRGDGEVE
jgi:tellurite resistance protein